MNTRKRRILIFIDWFTPAYKAGGPIKSISNFVNHLSGDFNLFIVTSDRDLGDNHPFSNVKFNHWIQNDDYSIIYLTKDCQKATFYHSIFKKIKPDSIYLNSLFSYRFSILPLICFKNIVKPIFLSPRGMLGPESLRVKSLKKKFYLFVSKIIGIYENVTWIACSKTEQKEIFNIIGKNSSVNKIPNLPVKYSQTNSSNVSKEKGVLSIICICRISPIKNLTFLADVLSKVNGQVSLSIVGPIEDSSYWNQCLQKFNSLNSNIKVNYLKEKTPFEIADLIDNHHLLISTSLNENYGHSIVEALSVGCPVIVSNHSPWRELNENLAGENLDLVIEQYAEKINFYTLLNQTEFLKYRNGAIDYFKKKIDLDIFKEAYIRLFS